MVIIAKFQPVIKWSGSKRSQAENIINYFPKQINSYYEPFCGGGSILRQLLDSDIKVKQYICSDINRELIELWNMIKDNPSQLSSQYNKMWHELNIDNDLERKKKYFNKVRERFNKQGNPEDFLFISRTTVNGLIRYNQKGKFNNSFHVTRNGIMSDKLEKIIYEWSDKIKDVEFNNCDYKTIVNCNKDDFIYLDPPYAETVGRYFGKINYIELWDWIRDLNCNYILSFDGMINDKDMTYNVPKDIYSKHIYLENGLSTFKKTQDKKKENVKESLYIS